MRPVVCRSLVSHSMIHSTRYATAKSAAAIPTMMNGCSRNQRCMASKSMICSAWNKLDFTVADALQRLHQYLRYARKGLVNTLWHIDR